METTIFGPPGTGKTTRLISIVQKEIEDGTAPEKIAFVSFSRKAAEEARTRATEKLNISLDSLPWFRTLHSLAFQCLGLSTGDVLRGKDYHEIGKLSGMEFTTNASLTMAEGSLFGSGKSGDAYLGLIQTARVRGVSLEEQFRQVADRRLHFQQAKVIEQLLYDYKRVHGKCDFVDMIENFVREKCGPSLDVLIVDEAQDLVPMQWKMVHEVLKVKAKRIYYAGDDDQCIYSWMGVNVKDFLNACENKEILLKSFRLPKEIFNLSDSVAKRIQLRQLKRWHPVENTGLVVWHRDINDLNLNEGEWLILTRTNHLKNMIGNNLKDQGHLFWKEGSGWSISPNVLKGIEIWQRLVKQQKITSEEVKTILSLLKKEVIKRGVKKILNNLDGDKSYSLNDLQKIADFDLTSDMMWYHVLKVSEKERIYITSVRRRGEKILSGTPRIKISTIHKAKGGEADNVALLLDTTKSCAESIDQDSEVRTFYVGMTRAKKELHMIESNSYYSFKI